MNYLHALCGLCDVPVKIHPDFKERWLSGPQICSSCRDGVPTVSKTLKPLSFTQPKEEDFGVPHRDAEGHEIDLTPYDGFIYGEVEDDEDQTSMLQRIIDKYQRKHAHDHLRKQYNLGSPQAREEPINVEALAKHWGATVRTLR